MPAPSEPVVRVATPADRDAVVATVVAAFDRDPAFRLYFGAATFPDDAGTFVGALFDRRVGLDTVWVTDDADSVAMWVAPRVDGDGDHSSLPAGARARLDTWDTAVHALMPREPHWYLGVLATHPRRAGEGLARAVVRPGLEAARADGLPAYLETATAANVAMYRRRGWTVVDAVVIAGITATVMRLDAVG